MGSTTMAVGMRGGPKAVRRWWHAAGRMLAWFIVSRAARRAMRELATLDDRVLADMGLARADLAPVCSALTGHWNCARTLEPSKIERAGSGIR